MPDLDARLSNLEKRQFLMYQAKKSTQTILHRRYPMCYRFGPFTREQVSELMVPFKAEVVPGGTKTPAAPSGTDTAASHVIESIDAPAAVAPSVAEGVEVAYLDPAVPWAADLGVDTTGTCLAPAAVVTVDLLYDDTPAKLRHTESYEAVIFPLDGIIDVEDVLTVDHDDRDFVAEPPPGASYQLGNTKLQNKTFWRSLHADVKSYLVANQKIKIWKCPTLKLYSRVGESEEDFAARCRVAAEQFADEAMSKLKDQYARRIDTLQDQISAADTRVKELEADASARTQSEVMSGLGDLLGAFLKGRLGSTTLSKAASRRAASKKVQVRLKAQEQKLTDKQQDLVDLEQDLEDALINIQEEHDALAANTETLEIGLEKTDIRVAEAKLVWVPVA